MEEITSPSQRTTVRTMAKRGSYDKSTIYKILDASFVCHIGFNSGRNTFVIPVVFGRKDDRIFFHGGKGSRLHKTIKGGIDICITVTSLDGLVLARSAFHHSVNYSSVVAFGKAVEVERHDKKIEALEIITNHLLPGRWDDVRKPNQKELNATTVLSFELNEASAKIRNGPVADEYFDMELPVWAGIIPLKLTPSQPVPDEKLKSNIPVPSYIKEFLRKRMDS